MGVKREEAVVSYTMSRIRGKDTGIEMALRKELFKLGLRYRANSNKVYGHPDVSFQKYKVAVFCDSEFWHGYRFAENETKIKTNRDYWIPKIKRNIARDEEVNAFLTSQGYRVLRFWGKEIEEDAARCAQKVLEALRQNGYSK